MSRNKTRKSNPKIAATITPDKKKALFNLKIKKGTTYAELIRHALNKTYGI